MTNIVEILARVLTDVTLTASSGSLSNYRQLQAIAVLQSLHDNITDEMMRAGVSGLSWSGVDEANIHDASTCFQAMIKAAMNEGEG